MDWKHCSRLGSIFFGVLTLASLTIFNNRSPWPALAAGTCLPTDPINHPNRLPEPECSALVEMMTALGRPDMAAEVLVNQDYFIAAF